MQAGPGLPWVLAGPNSRVKAGGGVMTGGSSLTVYLCCRCVPPSARDSCSGTSPRGPNTSRRYCRWSRRTGTHLGGRTHIWGGQTHTHHTVTHTNTHSHTRTHSTAVIRHTLVLSYSPCRKQVVHIYSLSHHLKFLRIVPALVYCN